MVTTNIEKLFERMGFLRDTSIHELEKVTPFSRQQLYNMMTTLTREKSVKKTKRGDRIFYTRVKKTRSEQRSHRGKGAARVGVPAKKKDAWDVKTPPPHTGKARVNGKEGGGMQTRIEENLSGKHAKTDGALQAAFREAAEKEKPEEIDPITKEEVFAASEAILGSLAIIDKFAHERVEAKERVESLEKENAELKSRLAAIERNLKNLLNPGDKR